MVRKLPKLRTIIKRLDKKFSKMRRLQEANGSYCTCVTCGKIEHWKKCDAGHYVERDILWTRFDKMNVFPQCIPCNRFKGGRKGWFGAYLRVRFGNDPIDAMVALSKKTDLRNSVEKIENLLEIEKEVDAELKDLKDGL